MVHQDRQSEKIGRDRQDKKRGKKYARVKKHERLLLVVGDGWC